MGIKRGKSNPPTKSSDKKARYDAGMDLVPGGAGYMELDESMLEEILREVRAPKPVQTQIDQFISDISKQIKKFQFSKVNAKSVEAFPWYKFDNKIKFPGGSVVSCSPVGDLKSRTLGLYL